MYQLAVLLIFVLCPHLHAATSTELPKAAAFLLRATDESANSMRIGLLRELKVKPRQKEIRVWVGFGIVNPDAMYRFRISEQGSVDGQIYLHYQASLRLEQETNARNFYRKTTANCFVVGAEAETESCLRQGIQLDRMQRAYDDIVASGLWTLPDQSEAPQGRNGVKDGVSMLVELRDGDQYRAYHWSNPAFSKGSYAEAALSILNLLKGI